MSLPTARGVAASVLVRVLEDGAFAAAVLDAEVSRALQLEPRDRALATELVYGSLRVLPWLDARILRHAPRGLGGVDPRTHAELVLSAYQLFFLERVPAFAAVNEAVEAVKKARGPRLAAFANAVLRKLATEAAAAKSAGGHALLLEAVQASLPAWIHDALSRTLGRGRGDSVLRRRHPPSAGGAPRGAPRGSRRVAGEARGGGPRTRRSRRARSRRSAILARGGGKTEALARLRRGAGAVQEEGSQLVALALGARPGDVVLDACAGRGNKAAVLAQAVGPAARSTRQTSTRRSSTRLETRARAAGAPAPGDATRVDWSVGAGDVPPGYDRALVDAPCSGVGTLRRRPDLALRRDPEDLGRLAALQAAIVARGRDARAPGGRLVYAVCSVLREEAEEVVAAVLASDAGLDPAPFDAAAARALSGRRADPTPAPPCARHRRLLPRELRAPRLAGW